MGDKPDWFKLDAAKFLQDSIVDAMSTEELGATIRLLCRQWIDGFIPDDIDLLGRLCRLNRSAMDTAWPLMSKFFPEIGDGKRANRFMWVERESVVASMAKRRDDGRAAVQKRWDAIRDLKETYRSPIPNLIQEEEKETEREKEVQVPPLTPPTGGVTVAGGDDQRAKRKRRSKAQIIGAYSLDVQRVVNEAINDWPEFHQEGSPIRSDLALLASNVGLIMKDNPSVTADDLIAAFRQYLAARPKPKYYKAPQFFFGRGKGETDTPRWMVEYQLLQHERMAKDATNRNGSGEGIQPDGGTEGQP